MLHLRTRSENPRRSWRAERTTGLVRPVGRIATLAGVMILAAACSSAGQTADPTPTLKATPSPEVTVRPAGAPCQADGLSAKVTAWEGAAGSRIATLELMNTGGIGCTVPAAGWASLVDANGKDLIEGSRPAGTADVTLAPGETLTTSIRVSNYCGADPVTPLTFAIILPAGDRVLAAPISPTDTAVPPCMGDPGSAGLIEMQPWQPAT